MLEKSQYKTIVVAGAFIIILILLVVVFGREKEKGAVDIDAFALCLKEKGATMYGSQSCGHCQTEKNAFGSSFQIIPYVECSKEPEKCISQGITITPTWIFSDGKRLEGLQGLDRLSKESRCALTNNSIWN